jgi:hypothetical protein
MAAANRLLGNHYSRCIPLVGIREGEMIMTAIAMFHQLFPQAPSSPLHSLTCPLRPSKIRAQ